VATPVITTDVGDLMLIARRTSTGQTLVLAVVLTMILTIIGIGIFYLTRLLGGDQEAQNYTDAGTLNTAVQEVFNAVPLNTIKQGSQVFDEPTNFSQWNPNAPIGTPAIDLFNFDGLVSQAAIVAVNAADENDYSGYSGSHYSGKQALTNAQTVAAACNGDIGHRLQLLLASNTSDNNVANNAYKMANPLSLLSWNSKPNLTSMYSQYYNSSDVLQNATNAWLDSTILPAEATPKEPNGHSHDLDPSLTDIIRYGTDKKYPQDSGLAYSINYSQGWYLQGYYPITLSALSTTPLAGVPVRPNRQPILTSANETSATKIPNSTLGITNIPPNAFHLQATATDPDNPYKPSTALQTQAYTIVGIPNNAPKPADLPASIPNGYIKICNPPGWPPPPNIPDATQTIFSKQLDGANTYPDYGGIYIALDSSQNAIAFAAGKNGLNDLWQCVVHNTKDSKVPLPSSSNIYGTNGKTLGDLTGIKNLYGAMPQPESSDIPPGGWTTPSVYSQYWNGAWEYYNGSMSWNTAAPCPCSNSNAVFSADPLCDKYYGEFFTAYAKYDDGQNRSFPPAPYSGGAQSKTLMAVEQTKLMVLQSWGLVYKDWVKAHQGSAGTGGVQEDDRADCNMYNPSNPRGPFPAAPSPANIQDTLPAPNAPTGQNNSQPSYIVSGLRLYPHTQYTAGPPQYNPVFSAPGTIPQLIQQATGLSVKDFLNTTVGQRLVKRIREIKPEANQPEVESLISGSNITLDLGENAYIYMIDPFGARTLVLKTNKPSWAANADTEPADGPLPVPTPGTGPPYSTSSLAFQNPDPKGILATPPYKLTGDLKNTTIAYWNHMLISPQALNQLPLIIFCI